MGHAARMRSNEQRGRTPMGNESDVHSSSVISLEARSPRTRSYNVTDLPSPTDLMKDGSQRLSESSDEELESRFSKPRTHYSIMPSSKSPAHRGSSQKTESQALANDVKAGRPAKHEIPESEISSFDLQPGSGRMKPRRSTFRPAINRGTRISSDNPVFNQILDRLDELPPLKNTESLIEQINKVRAQLVQFRESATSQRKNTLATTISDFDDENLVEDTSTMSLEIEEMTTTITKVYSDDNVKNPTGWLMRKIKNITKRKDLVAAESPSEHSVVPLLNYEVMYLPVSEDEDGQSKPSTSKAAGVPLGSIETN